MWGFFLFDGIDFSRKGLARRHQITFDPVRFLWSLLHRWCWGKPITGLHWQQTKKASEAAQQKANSLFQSPFFTRRKKKIIIIHFSLRFRIVMPFPYLTGSISLSKKNYTSLLPQMFRAHTMKYKKKERKKKTNRAKRIAQCACVRLALVQYELQMWHRFYTY